MFGKKKELFEESSLDGLLEENGYTETESFEKRGFGRTVGRLFGFVAASCAAGALVVVPPLMTVSAALPVAEPLVKYWNQLPEELEDIAIAQRNTIQDANGDTIATVYSEDRQMLTSIDDVSPVMRQALLDTEDKNFYNNPGFDAKGIVRSAVSGSGGGSGITQQLVKNLRFYNLAGRDKKAEATESSINRKVVELKYAIGYEKTHTKDEILLNYLNTVAIGGPNTYSIESAARYYFGKTAKKLDLAESAALAGSVQNPSLYNLASKEKKNQKAIKERQAMVLGRMVANGHITQAQADKAKKQKLNVVLKNKDGNGTCYTSKYPFYCQYVMDYMKKSPKLGETDEERSAVLAKGGLTIKTYMVPDEMKAIDQQLSRDFGKKNRVVTPVAVVTPGNGGVTGFGVNRDFGVGKGKTTINVANNPAATGSTYKMVTLAAALESGMTESQLSFSSQCPLHPGSGYDAPAGGFNNSQSCSLQGGQLNYRQATAYSSNTWFITLAMKTGMKNVINMSKAMNLNVPDGVTERSLSFVIGSAENSPIDMAAMYATFANGGIFCPATPVASYSYADGTTPAVPDTYDPASDSCRRVMSPHTASVVLKAMRANTYKSDGVPGAFSTNAQIKGYDAVGKSGTNQRYNFAWAQVSSKHSLFIDIYDMDRLTRGVYGNMLYKGSYYPGNMAAQAGSDVFRNLISTEPSSAKKGKLDYNSKDSSLVPVPVETRDFFTIPQFAGMEPAQALDAARALGIDANVSKATVERKGQYPSGVIVDQSLEAGTRLPVGTKKDLVLYVSE